MKVLGKLDNVDSMEATLTITMTLQEWREVAETLPRKWPHWKLGGAITELVTRARTVFSQEVKESCPPPPTRRR